MKKFNARGGQRVLNRPTPASRGGTRLQAGVRRQAEFDAKRSSTPSGVRRQAESDAKPKFGARNKPANSQASSLLKANPAKK